MELRSALVGLLCFLTSAEAVILYRTGDPNENRTAPSGDLANSGWQYEGQWGGFLGTPIAPFFFISAQHIGHQGDLVYNGTTYHVVAEFNDPESDLKILQVAQPFSTFAPLYSRSDEAGKRIAEFGRGTQRGTPVTLNSVEQGWNWGAGDGAMRWGENIVSGIYPFGENNDLLFANFDANGLPNECHLSVGDSGGAAFINDNGTWKLAGINYTVDGPFYTDAAGNGAFNAALFDMRGFYQYDGTNFVQITGATPQPSALYPTRISKRLLWIARVIATPAVTHSGNLLSLTYTKFDLPPSDLAYTIEQSTDLISWTMATTTDEIVSSIGSVQTVKSTVNGGNANRLFLRLRLTRP